MMTLACSILQVIVYAALSTAGYASPLPISNSTELSRYNCTQVDSLRTLLAVVDRTSGSLTVFDAEAERTGSTSPIPVDKQLDISEDTELTSLMTTESHGHADHEMADHRTYHCHKVAGDGIAAFDVTISPGDAASSHPHQRNETDAAESVSFICASNGSQQRMLWTFRRGTPGSGASPVNGNESMSTQTTGRYSAESEQVENIGLGIQHFMHTGIDGPHECRKKAINDNIDTVNVNQTAENASVLSSSRVNTTVGESVNFSCPSNRSAGVVQWTFRSATSGSPLTLFSGNTTGADVLPGSSRYSLVVDAAAGHSLLTIARVDLSDRGTFECRTGRNDRFVFKLTVFDEQSSTSGLSALPHTVVAVDVVPTKSPSFDVTLIVVIASLSLVVLINVGLAIHWRFKDTGCCEKSALNGNQTEHDPINGSHDGDQLINGHHQPPLEVVVQQTRL